MGQNLLNIMVRQYLRGNIERKMLVLTGVIISFGWLTDT